MRTSLIAASLATVLLAGCGGDTVRAIPEPDGVTVLGAGIARRAPDVRADDLRRLTDAQVDFAIDVYRAVAASETGDLALGPGSLHAALSMLLAGAQGKTADDIAKLLHASDFRDQLHDFNNALDRELRSRGETKGIDVDIANRVWAGRGLKLGDAFVRSLASSYGAALASVDFAADPEKARAAVNEWVAAATRDMIDELFPDGSITHETVLVLANAVYLNAKWKFPFDPASTHNGYFHLADGTKILVPTMAYDEYLPSGRGRDWSAVRLPYAGEKLSMTVIVPDKDIAAFERSLDRAKLAEVEAAIKDGGIHLTLPRFVAKTHLSLADTLVGMGMPRVFGPATDPAQATGLEGLQLGAIEHEAVVEVDERGTEAAAASGGSMLGSHGPTVMVDRPFLFVIRDQPTGAVLFLGRVMDPR